MPRRTDIRSILLIGSGPIVIGQACEFDYSGTQACKALREEGYRVILVNSNPATIMTDPDLADATYIEPITPESVAKIIAKERPDALLPTMGGQTALNCALSLRKMGVLEAFKVEMIGATADAIDMAEDRKLFREAMTRIGLATPRSHQIKTLAAALAVPRELWGDTGGSTVQFAITPTDGRLVGIEMNPRVSRSSALASKATGFPIAKVAAKLAVGYTLDELDNDITGGVTPASFEPTIDYVVTKIPRFTFEKFPAANDRLTTQMKSVGEVMAIGRTFQESLQKALRGLETGLEGLTPQLSMPLSDESADRLAHELRAPGADRLLYVADAFRAGWSLARVAELTHIDAWFLAQVEELVGQEKHVREEGFGAVGAERLPTLKR